MLCFRPVVLPGQLEHHEQEERQLKLETLSLAMVLGNSLPTTPSERLLDCIGMPKNNEPDHGSPSRGPKLPDLRCEP